MACRAGIKAIGRVPGRFPSRLPEFTGGAGNVPKGAVEEVGKAGIGIVNIVYDNDDEGRAGAQKAARELQESGWTVCIRRIPESMEANGDGTTRKRTDRRTSPSPTKCGVPPTKASSCSPTTSTAIPSP